MQLTRQPLRNNDEIFQEQRQLYKTMTPPELRAELERLEQLTEPSTLSTKLERTIREMLARDR